MLRANKTFYSKYGQDSERRRRDERSRRRRMGGGSMMRGDMTTSRGGQETTAQENERGATRDSGEKRDGGMIGRGALAWRQWRISGGGAVDKETTTM